MKHDASMSMSEYLKYLLSTCIKKVNIKVIVLRNTLKLQNILSGKREFIENKLLKWIFPLVQK